MSIEINLAEHIRVAPYTSVISALDSTRSLHTGGPIWPEWQECIKPRHCRNNSPIDHIPSDEGFDTSTEILESGYWCGPIVNHYGHQIADFSTRLPLYLGRHSYDKPLIFGTRERRYMNKIPTFFEQILAWYNVPKNHIRVCDVPTIFEKLFWVPQQEQLVDVAPSAHYVSILSDHAAYNLAYPMKSMKLFVSRAGCIAGIIAGEKYLEEFFSDLGYAIIRPERISLREQLTLYQNASTIIFSEGSAVHTLQLLGYIDARVAIISRRPKRCMAIKILSTRIKHLSYINAISAFVQPRSSLGSIQPNFGIAFLDLPSFFEQLCSIGIDSSSWSMSQYSLSMKACFEKWLPFIRSKGFSPGVDKNLAVILASIGIANSNLYDNDPSSDVNRCESD